MELTRVKKYPFWQIKCDRKETTSSERLTRKEQNISLIMKTHSNNICKCKPHNVNMWEMSRKWELFRKRKYWESESCWDSESDWKSRNKNYLLKWLGHLSAVAVWACARCRKWWHLWSNHFTLETLSSRLQWLVLFGLWFTAQPILHLSVRWACLS